MLDLMRKHANSWFVSIIIGAIVVVFVLWGIGTFRSAQFQKVAAVDGVNIYLPEYLRAYQNLMRTYQERLGGDFNEEAVKALNLKAQTLNQLIDEILLQQAAKRLGLVVTDAELRQYIQNIPVFADERGFNEKRYQQVLARQRIPASDFEARERQRLLLQKVVGFITSFAKLSEADLQETYRLEQEAIRIEYLTLGPAAFLKDQQVAPAETEAFYNKHQELFREPEKFRARYVFLKFRDFQANLKTDPQKVEDFFYDHLDQFSRPQAIRFQEIVLETPKTATAADRQRLRQLAETILRNAQAGAGFDQLAKKYGQISGLQLKVEDLGVVKRGQTPPDWETAAFKLKEGEFGLAVTSTGYHILHATEIVDNKAPAFATVRSDVEKAWLEAEAVRLARQQATERRAEMLKSSFESTSQQHQLKVQETPLLSAKEAIPGLGLQPAVTQAALSLKPQEIAKPIALENGIVLLQVLDRKESFIPPFNDIKARATEAARFDKAREAARQEAGKIQERLKKGENLAKVASQLKLTVQDSGFFTRPQGFTGHAQSRNLTTAAFSLTPSHPYPDEPIAVNGENFLLVFKERRQPNPEQFAQAKEQMEKALLDLKRQMVFSQWLAEEKRRANIKVYELPS